MLRRLSILSVLLAVILTPTALAANVKIRVEGKTHDDLRRGAAARRGRQRAPGPRRRPARPASSTTALTTADVRRLRQPDRQVRRRPARPGWVFKVNGVSPPVGADKVTLKDGDVVLWYYATFGATGGPPTLELQRLPANCYVVQTVNDAGKKAARGDSDAHGGREAVQDAGPAAPASASTSGSSGRRARRRPLERGAVIRRAAQRVRSSLSSSPAAAAPPARGRGRRSSGSRATEAPSCSSTRRSRPGRR